MANNPVTIPVRPEDVKNPVAQVATKRLRLEDTYPVVVWEPSNSFGSYSTLTISFKCYDTVDADGNMLRVPTANHRVECLIDLDPQFMGAPRETGPDIQIIPVEPELEFNANGVLRPALASRMLDEPEFERRVASARGFKQYSPNETNTELHSINASPYYTLTTGESFDWGYLKPVHLRTPIAARLIINPIVKRFDAGGGSAPLGDITHDDPVGTGNGETQGIKLADTTIALLRVVMGR